MVDGLSKRLAPDERKDALLSAAIDLLARKGLAHFSLEAVAREAGVADSLPRHYFGGYRDLLKAATEGLLKSVENTLLSRDVRLDLRSRVVAYLELLSSNPWGHHVWLRSADIHRDINSIVRKARRRMAESMYGKTWQHISTIEQYDARGRIGYIEAVVANWLERGAPDLELVADIIVTTISTSMSGKQAKRRAKNRAHAKAS